MGQRSDRTKITAYTGCSLVIANMIGTGAFTSLGFQLENISNTAAILTLWILGGLMALSGAFSYAEVGTVIKKSGGEYTFLSTIYHPLIGYLSGWISLTVGFAAPVALSAIAFTNYFPLHSAYPKLVAIGVVSVISLFHSYNLNVSSRFQNISTLFKLLLIFSIILLGVWLPVEDQNAICLETSYCNEVTSSAFAVSLIYVSYSYSGWNAAAYITEEFRNPRRALPLALIGGTMVVTVLYTLLQFVFLKHVPMADLVGRLNVGSLAINRMLGVEIGYLFGAAISLLLISGISAMIWVGPRVTASIGNDYALWRYFKKQHVGIPKRAIALQWGISVLLLITGTFEQIMIYCGILLTVSSALVVIGVFILRNRDEASATERFRAPFFPFFQVVYVLISLWIVIFAFINSTFETCMGMLNLLVGLFTFYLSNRCRKK